MIRILFLNPVLLRRAARDRHDTRVGMRWTRQRQARKLAGRVVSISGNHDAADGSADDDDAVDGTRRVVPMFRVTSSPRRAGFKSEAGHLRRRRRRESVSAAGEQRDKPLKPLRAERRTCRCFRGDFARVPKTLICARGCGCIAHPAFCTPSFLRAGTGRRSTRRVFAHGISAARLAFELSIGGHAKSMRPKTISSSSAL